VSPSSVTSTWAPDPDASQLAPPSVLRWCSIASLPAIESRSAVAFVHPSGAPDTTGTPGAVRSSWTTALLDHGEALPARSTAANCTRVSPSAATVTSSAGPAAQDVPPSVEIRERYDAIPDAGAGSRAVPCVTVRAGAAVQSSLPPSAGGAEGATVSTRHAAVAVAVNPFRSTSRTCAVCGPSGRSRTANVRVQGFQGVRSTRQVWVRTRP